MTFKPGDLVKLKSGGPQMTVSHVSGENRACHCVWFVDNQVVMHTFTQDSLQAG